MVSPRFTSSHTDPKGLNLPSRYDLQIRYLPEDFLESLKEDRTTLLYYYQQVGPVPSMLGVGRLGGLLWATSQPGTSPAP